MLTMSIVLSPGPGLPKDAGLLLDIIKTYTGRKPILGICLGHQAIGQVFRSKAEKHQKGVSRNCDSHSNIEIKKACLKDKARK